MNLLSLKMNGKLRKYKIQCLAKRKNISFEEATVLFEKREAELKGISGAPKKVHHLPKGSVITRLSGKTNSRTWNKVK